MSGGPPPSLSVNDVSVTEGTGGTVVATFTVSLSPASGQTVMVDYGTADGTATSGLIEVADGFINIPVDGGASSPIKANPYPSPLTVPAVPGNVTGVTPSINGFGHTWPRDVDALLVDPTGTGVVLMSDVGGTSPMGPVGITFSDAGTPLPTSAFATGTYRPTNLDDSEPAGGDMFPDAPVGPYDDELMDFNGVSPVGTWNLYVADDFATTDSGSISGWSLSIQTDVRDYTPTMDTLTFTPGQMSRTFMVTIEPDATAESNETFLVNLTNPSNAILGDPQGVGTILDSEGIAVRTGHHCAQPVMAHFDVAATVRASFALYNTLGEVEVLLEGLDRVREIFR